MRRRDRRSRFQAIAGAGVAASPLRFTDWDDQPAVGPVQDWSIAGSGNGVYNVVDLGAGDFAVRATHTANPLAWDGLLWDTLGSNLTDVEIVARLRMSHKSSGRSYAGLAVRANNANAHLMGFRSDTNGDTVRLNKVVAGTKGGYAGGGTFSIAFPWVINTWYWIRYQIIGNQIRGKVWQDGSAEPGAWQLTATNAEIAAGGVGLTDDPFAHTGNRDFAIVGVSLDPASEPAPMVAP